MYCKTVRGFTVHTSVDEDSFLKNYNFMAGNIYDSKVFKELLIGSEHEAYIDRAYKNSEHDQILEDKSISNYVSKQTAHT